MRNKKGVGSIIVLVLLIPISISSLPYVVPAVHAVTWVPETQVTNKIGWDTYPNLYRLASGTLLLFFSTNQYGPWEIYLSKSFNNGTTWTPPQNVTTGAQNVTTGLPNHAGSALAQLRNGTLILFYASNQTGTYNILYRASNNLGLTWGPEITTFPNNLGSYSFRPAALVAKDGTLWVVWHSQVAGNWDLYYATSSNGGTSWVGPTRLTSDPGSDLAPSIAQGPDGRIWVAWGSDRVKGSPEVFIKYWNEILWSTEQQITFDPSLNNTPSLTVADDGTMWLAWDSDRNTNPVTGFPVNEIYYKYSYDNGATWSADYQGTTDLNHDSNWPTMFQTGSGRFGVAFSSPRLPNGSHSIFYGQLTTSDLGVVSVSPSFTAFPPDALAKVYVTLKNHGATTETFTASLYANSTLVASLTTTLSPGAVTVWSATWDTHGMSLGRYYLKASIPPALGETDLADNQLTSGPVWLRIPDIAVTSISTVYNWVYQGNNVTAAVTVQNLDSTPTPETFLVQLLVDGSPVASKIASGLAQSASRTISLNWTTTTSTTFGNHTLAAYAVPLPGEVNTSNNLLGYGNIKVLLVGDVNQDAKVNTIDFYLILQQLGKSPGTWDPFWGPRCDVNNDGKVNTIDAYIVINHLGQTATY